MTLEQYRGMLIQSTRVEAFRRRLREVVRPGDRVLEVGSGLGTFAFFAAQAGAAKVWAVEGAPIIHVARALARHNGLDDRVEFLRGWFPGVRIPEPVDVLIFEDFNPRLIDQTTWNALRVIHDGMLRPDARIVPDHARLMLAPVSGERNWEVIGPLGPEDVAYDIDWTPSRPYAYNTPTGMPLRPDELVREPVIVADVDLASLVTPASLGGTASWTFETRTTVRGLAHWFDLELSPGVWLTNRPEGDPGSWGYLYLPVAEPMVLEAGETLTARVGPEEGAGGAPGWLVWEVTSPRERFRGHEFLAGPASRGDLVRASPGWAPRLSARTRQEMEVMAMADGRRTIEAIGQEAVARGIVQTVEEGVVLAFALLEGKCDEEGA